MSEPCHMSPLLYRDQISKTKANQVKAVLKEAVSKRNLFNIKVRSASKENETFSHSPACENAGLKPITTAPLKQWVNNILFQCSSVC